jgi:uncharacterized membrane protein YagU involved in acid resistance
MRRAILFGGLAAGVLDIGAALYQAAERGSTSTRLFQAIASGWLGSASYEGGTATAVLGLFTHFLIAFTVATVFVVAARRVPFLISVTWLSGPVYGMLVWATMRFILLPLSAYPHPQVIRPGPMTMAVLIHVFCVGLPIALAARIAMADRR